MAGPRPRRASVSASVRKICATASSPKSWGVSTRASTVTMASDSTARTVALSVAHFRPDRVRAVSRSSPDPAPGGSWGVRIIRAFGRQPHLWAES